MVAKVFYINRGRSPEALLLTSSVESICCFNLTQVKKSISIKQIKFTPWHFTFLYQTQKQISTSKAQHNIILFRLTSD